MLGQIYTINRYIQFLGYDRVYDGQRNLVAFFGFQYLAQVTVLRIEVIGGVTAKAVYIIKNVVNELDLLLGAGLMHHLYPDVAFNALNLVNDLLLVKIRVLVAVNDQDALQQVKSAALMPKLQVVFKRTELNFMNQVGNAFLLYGIKSLFKRGFKESDGLHTV